MSLLNEIASAIGHTPETLAEVTGTSVKMLETVISGLGESGIEVFSAASRLGLTPDGLLRGIVQTMQSGDPHQQLLRSLQAPVQPMSDPVASLTTLWGQMADLHQNTARTIDQHIQALFSGSGTETYSGPAADTLWNTHQEFQRYFGTLVDHAQMQQSRHKTLSGHVDEYVSQMPSRVNGLSAPVAAFGVLSIQMKAAVAPPPLIDPTPLEQGEQELQQLAEGDPDPDSWTILEILAGLLYLLILLVGLIDTIAGAISSYNNQQKNTKFNPPRNLTPTPAPTPGTGLTPAQQQLLNDVKSRLGNAHYNDADIEALIKAGYTDPDAIAALISGKVTITGKFPSIQEEQQAVQFAQRNGGGNIHGLSYQRGIDYIFTPEGSNEQIPVSSKNFSQTSRMPNLIQRINNNAKDIKDEGYKDAILDANVPQWTSEDMLKFVQNGPIKNMPSEGVFKTLYFNCSDGIVVVDASGARIVR